VEVFLSWSGQKSRAVAVALRDWLPCVINSLKPFMSSKDIDAGARWQSEVATRLEATNFGIVCVTHENQVAPWLNFEAGALAKAVAASRVIPLAIDLKPSDIEIPLGQFQAQPASKAGLREIIGAVNSGSEYPLADSLLEKSYEKWWPDLEAKLLEIEETAAPPDAAPVRSERELLEEVLNTVRGLARPHPAPSDAQRGRLPESVMERARTLVRTDDGDAEVYQSASGRTVGVFGSRVPDDVKKELEELVGAYSATVVYPDEPSA
jgi:TIR domain